MLKNQIAQGVIIAALLGALAALGSSCAPVANSVPKMPARTNLNTDRTDAGKNADRIIEHTYILSKSDDQKTLELPDGLKEHRLSEEEVELIRSGKSTFTVSLPDVSAGLRVYTVIETKLSKEAISSRKLEQVQAHWTRLDVNGTDYGVRIVDGTKSNSKRDSVLENLTGITLNYRESD